MDNFINVYNNAIIKSDNIEFEITYHLIKSSIVYKNLVNKLKEDKTQRLERNSLFRGIKKFAKDLKVW